MATGTGLASSSSSLFALVLSLRSIMPHESLSRPCAYARTLPARIRSHGAPGFMYGAGTHQQPQRGAREPFVGCTVWTVAWRRRKYQWCVCVPSKIRVWFTLACVFANFRGVGVPLGMTYTRACASDYDDWENLYENQEWSSNELIPLLRK